MEHTVLIIELSRPMCDRVKNYLAQFYDRKNDTLDQKNELTNLLPL